MIIKKELKNILSEREIEVVKKRLHGEKISRTESNYLSRSIRPKLKAAEIVSSLRLRSLLDYRRKKYEREKGVLRRKIMGAVKRSMDIQNVQAIVVYGSYVRNYHIHYRDIDVCVVVKKKLWVKWVDKHRLKKEIEQKSDLPLDVHLIEYAELRKIYPYSPLLQNTLEICEILFGTLKLKDKVIINKNYLYGIFLEIEEILELGKEIHPKYLYHAIRSCLVLELFLQGIVRYDQVMKSMIANMGESTVQDLVEGRASALQKEVAFRYLRGLIDQVKEKLA